MKARALLLPGALLFALVLAAPAADKEKKEDANTRSVAGVVLDPNNKVVESAVVQLKNMKTLDVRSYITLKDGIFRFHDLSTNIDYQVKAEHSGLISPTRTLSMFDTRKKLNVSLRLEKK